MAKWQRGKIVRITIDDELYWIIMEKATKEKLTFSQYIHSLMENDDVQRSSKNKKSYGRKNSLESKKNRKKLVKRKGKRKNSQLQPPTYTGELEYVMIYGDDGVPMSEDPWPITIQKGIKGIENRGKFIALEDLEYEWQYI